MSVPDPARRPTRRRARHPLVAACLLLGLATGCGVQASAGPRSEGPDTPIAAPTATPADTPATDSGTTDQPGPDAVPEDFPLTDGLPRRNDDGSPVEVVPTTGIAPPPSCGARSWRVPTALDGAVVGFTAPEDVRSRTLLVLDTVARAQRTMADLREVIGGCPPARVSGTVWQPVEAVEESTPGQESFVATARYRADGLFDTGITVLRVVRSGRAVLISTEYSEGGGSRASIAASVRRAARDSADVEATAAAVWRPPGA